MGLALTFNEVAPSAGLDPASGLEARTVHGKHVSLTHARFPVGYHSVPHAHEGEEISQVLEGGLSVYLDGQELVLGEGDIFRIPALAVHWKRNRSDRDAVLLELHNPPRRGSSLLDTFERDDASFDGSPPIRFGETYRASRYYADGEDAFPVAPEESPLFARGKDIWDGIVPLASSRNHGNIGETKSVRIGGESMVVLLAERIGFKMRPHFHAAEQLSFVVSGDMWTFVDDRVFFSRPGEFIRVPGNVVHYAMVDPGESAFTFEVHSPPQGDPTAQSDITWLVPPHRIPHVKWIPGGFINDALPVDELAAYEAGLLQATAESLELQGRVAGQDIKPTGARR